MKKILLWHVALVAVLASCTKPKNEENNWKERALDVASYQLLTTAREVADSALMPRSTWTGYEADFLTAQMERPLAEFYDSVEFAVNPPASQLGKRRLCGVLDWTSGFFPGSLWYLYELTGKEEFRQEAVRYTNLLNPVRYVTDNHDVGFMVNCSYGNALRLAPNDTIQALMVETADNLCSRFNSQVGCIRSWDFGHWNYPVIIDNMMNLDLLFNVYRLTKNKRYYDVAVSHALTTMQHHFRPDYTSYHVVSYNNDGTVECKETHQGKHHESSWARGQAWAVYGYTLCYRETHQLEFLNQAIYVANMIMERVKTDDRIPYWDYEAPVRPDTPRDVSAAAITASALLELSTLAPDGQKYFSYAEEILKNLTGKEYMAEKGTNQGFILKHSVGSLPHGSEIDTPLNYADYYFLEALKRYTAMQQ